MTNLFVARADSDLTWEMVEEFCKAGPREAIRVEYKSDMPNDVEKHISSFANTWGGLILIGVATDSENKPIVPVAGMQFRKGLTEQIFQKCTSSIYPPLLPDVWLVRREKANSLHADPAVLVIRVNESEDKLHSVKERTGIYFRTGNISNPFRRADVEEISSLLKKREFSAELRRELLTQSKERYEFHFEANIGNELRKVPEGQREALRIHFKRRAQIRFYCTPVLPRMPLCGVRELHQFLQGIRCLRTTGRGGYVFPSAGVWKTTQNGLENVSFGKFVEVADVTEFGSISFSFDNPEEAEFLRDEDSSLCMRLNPMSIGGYFGAFLSLALKTYDALKYFGALEIAAKITNARGHSLGFAEKCADSTIYYSTNPTVTSLRATFQSVFVEFVERIYFSFGDVPHDIATLTQAAARTWEANLGA